MSDHQSSPGDTRNQDARHDEQRPADRPDQRPRFLQVVHSVLAALFGVQSGANRERDFQKGKAGDYIGVFVVMVIALVIGMFVVVSIVINAATGG
ncbi:DUF2970 domain-containing protein [Alloalcanivorax sp. C16-1]|uniref:DUF2970 domain-containing protein n=1 Tax=Alloalcanivorax sp. C16-1 TaxID=3390051 RepID=UPI003971109C